MRSPVQIEHAHQRPCRSRQGRRADREHVGGRSSRRPGGRDPPLRRAPRAIAELSRINIPPGRSRGSPRFPPWSSAAGLSAPPGSAARSRFRATAACRRTAFAPATPRLQAQAVAPLTQRLTHRAGLRSPRSGIRDLCRQFLRLLVLDVQRHGGMVPSRLLPPFDCSCKNPSRDADSCPTDNYVAYARLARVRQPGQEDAAEEVAIRFGAEPGPLPQARRPLPGGARRPRLAAPDRDRACSSTGCESPGSTH